jgi:hypothetical protein
MVSFIILAVTMGYLFLAPRGTFTSFEYLALWLGVALVSSLMNIEANTEKEPKVVVSNDPA